MPRVLAYNYTKLRKMKSSNKVRPSGCSLMADIDLTIDTSCRAYGTVCDLYVTPTTTSISMTVELTQISGCRWYWEEIDTALWEAHLTLNDCATPPEYPCTSDFDSWDLYIDVHSGGASGDGIAWVCTVGGTGGIILNHTVVDQISLCDTTWDAADQLVSAFATSGTVRVYEPG